MREGIQKRPAVCYSFGDLNMVIISDMEDWCLVLEDGETITGDNFAYLESLAKMLSLACEHYRSEGGK